MLTDIKIKNLAIIDELHIELAEGLNILSGETGSGKSIILKGLTLLMGEKASAEIVKAEKEFAEVEGRFELSQRPDVRHRLQQLSLLGDESELVARRVISAQGKNKVYINGHLCNLTTLKEIISPLIDIDGETSPLIEMTGQHESKSLTENHFSLDLLDQHCRLWKERKTMHSSWQELSNKRNELQELEKASLQREQRLDFLRFQIDEITSLGLEPGSEKEIEGDYHKVKTFKSLLSYLEGLEHHLYSGDESIVDRLQLLIQECPSAEKIPELQRPIELLTQCKALLEECAFEARDLNRKNRDNPLDLETVEERMSRWRKLQKKYGATSEQILNQLSEMRSELEGLEHGDSRIRSLRNEITNLENTCISLAENLHKSRVQGALSLKKLVNIELRDLNMKGVEFGIAAEKLSVLGPLGFTHVEFKLRSGPKDSERPLASTGSGGELSRILLSLKKVIGGSEHPRTHLFDEVDSGVSGETAERVGRKLKQIAHGRQVVCITHLPQVAIFADAHFLISKKPNSNRTLLTAQRLKQTEREEEIARLISGKDVTNSSRMHARKLLEVCLQD